MAHRVPRPPAEHSASKIVCISEFVQKIKIECARGHQAFRFDECKVCCITRIDGIDQSTILLARRSKAELNCRTGA
jgi:hypothetical protein